MEQIKQLTLIELERDEELLKKVDKLLGKYNLDGKLEYIERNGNYQYYICKTKNYKKHRKYIRNKDLKVAEKIANRDYLNEVKSYLSYKIEKEKSILEVLEFVDIHQIYKNLPRARKNLVNSISETPLQKLQLWKSTPYKSLTINNSYDYIETINGERVRSKSEKILADLFHEKGIVYKYECPIYFDRVTLHPDFTFFDPANEKEIYWEHFGMIDNPIYSKNMMQKLATYADNGIILGKNLIVTFESSEKILDINYAENLIDQFLSF